MGFSGGGGPAGGVLSGTFPNPAFASPLVLPAGGETAVNSLITSFPAGGMTNLLNTTSGASILGIAGQWFFAPVVIPYNCTITGLVVAAGTIGGTDNWIVAMWNAAGGLPIATSALAGFTAPTANTKARQPFTAPVAVAGPAAYWIGLQTSGATARFLGMANAVEGFPTGQAAGVFGTPLSLTPPVAFTPTVGPMFSTY
jgi:hypothetical protein